MVLIQRKIEKVYLGDVEIRPLKKLVDFLLIGGGGGGGSGYMSSCAGGGGGGAGGVIQCENWDIATGTYNIVIGAGGKTQAPGCNSCFGSIVACGGGNGGGYNHAGGDGGSGGGGGGCKKWSYGLAVEGQGYHGGYGACYTNCKGSGGGGGGAGGVGGDGWSYCGGVGGIGIISDIDGTSKCYAGGGGGGGMCCVGCGNYGGGNGGGRSKAPTAPTTYGSGGGGGGCYSTSYICGCPGCKGVFILRYPQGKYDITGGCKYDCNGYTIHCFTEDGTLTVN